MKPAAAYLFSRDHGIFTPQRRAVESFARQNGYDVRFWFVDWNSSQRDLKRLKLYCRLHLFQAVLVTDLRAAELLGNVIKEYELELVGVPMPQ